MDLFLSRVASPLGQLLVVHDAAGRVRALDFDDCSSRMRRLLARQCPSRTIEAALPAELGARLTAFFDGDLHDEQTHGLQHRAAPRP
jgi:methylated-DNA-[protein]-cysteine S-methyltransferase